MSNPFEVESTNPFGEPSDSDNPFESKPDTHHGNPELSNPFGEDDVSSDDGSIEIPGLDPDVDILVSNPFRGDREADQLEETKSEHDLETRKIIENVNLTYRARSDEVIITQIKPDFFNLPPHSMVVQILNQITNDQELRSFKNLIKKVAELKAQLKAVERRLAKNIQSNEAAYKKHQIEIENLHDELIDTTEQIYKARDKMKTIKSETRKPLYIIKKTKSRSRATKLLDTLTDIRTLIELEQTLNDLLQRSEYTEAIKLMESCKKISSNFSKFPCCIKISNRLSDTSKMAINNLDEVLSQQTIRFDQDRFRSLLEAYELLNRQPGLIIEKILIFLENNINSSMRKILGVEGDTDYDKLSLDVICEAKIKSIEVMISILSLFSSIVWQMLTSFKSIQEHYNNTSKSAVRDLANSKFNAGKEHIWDEIQTSCKRLLTSVDLGKCNYDQLLLILIIGRRLTDIGSEFTKSESIPLQSVLKEAALSFFYSFHQNKIDDLKMFLTNEAWEPCPIRSDFDYSQLKEFKFLLKRKRSPKPPNTSNVQSDSSSVDSGISFKLLGSSKDPFGEEELKRVHSRDEKDDDDLEDSDDDEDPALLVDKVVEDGDEYEHQITETHFKSIKRSTSQKNGFSVVTTNSGLTILRFCGQYLQMADTLRPVAAEVIKSLCSLYDIYIYAVFTFFTEHNFLGSDKLQATMKRIEESDLPLAGMSGFVDFTADNFWGLGNRVVAIESLFSISKQMENLRPLMENLIPENRIIFFKKFYSVAVKVVPSELLRLIVIPFCKSAVQWREVMNQIASSNFNPKEISSDNSPYVADLGIKLDGLKNILDRIDRNLSISDEIRKSIWSETVNCVNYTMVDGFSVVSKCSAEGRALMNMDYQQIIFKIENISQMKINSSQKQFTEEYIRAYYLSEQELHKLIVENLKYSQKQLTSLVTFSGASLSKKTRQKFISIIEDRQM